jgi:hypothetical protein
MIYDVGVARVRSFDLLTPVNQKRFCKYCRALVVASSRNRSTSLYKLTNDSETSIADYKYLVHN